MHSRSEVTKSYNEIQARGKIQESPEVQPLTLLYTSFDRKGTTFFYKLLWTNGTPFTYLV